ncbi:MAG: hypothetical protein ACI38Q_09450 [Candidatus Bruticola sp.]
MNVVKGGTTALSIVLLGLSGFLSISAAAGEDHNFSSVGFQKQEVANVSKAVSEPAVLIVTGSPFRSSYLRSVLEKEGVSAEEIPGDLYPGEQFKLKSGLNVRNVFYPNLKAEVLAFSDHPERVKERGLLFKGGLVPFKPLRFQYYHEGGREDNRLWLRLNLNNTLSSRRAKVLLTEGEGGPDSDYFQAGHMNNVQFLSRLADGSGRLLELEPGETKSIFCRQLPYCEVISGTAQFTLLEGSGLTFNLNAVQSLEEELSFNLLANPQDVHARGLYACADQFISKVLVMDNRLESAQTWAAIGAVRQPNIMAGPELKGDYGVVYAIQFLAVNRSDRERNLELIINPRGGKASASVLMETVLRKGEISSANWLAKQVPDLESWRRQGHWQDCSLKREAEPFTEYKAASIVVPAEHTAEIYLLTVPEGASNYPVRFILRAVE